ncbi:MAG: heavy metal response regulator transcription factor [Betaproteobacteria bacterium]|nr:heavy metal response regulator transcription factor [Betaproteobacteria bacterium]MBI2959726.1 heavy metal response regulator transcription factor [Betaproteobacteria bacterium]
MKILIIEDTPSTVDYLRQGLSEHGFAVDVAYDGVDGRHMALEQDFDLIVLDVTMPRLDGWEVLKSLREKKDTPVIFLTARDRVDDRVKGLEMGADDYLVKPFSFSELLARIRALLKRSRTREPEILRINDLEVDLLRRQVFRAGKRVDLTAKEFALLALLLRRQGEVLSRTTLAEQVWDINFDSDTNVVEVAIWRLRSKIDDPFERKLLHTVRGMGYVLEDRDT